MIYIIALSVIAGVLGFYYYFFKDLNYFKKHGILHKPPVPILGNMGPSVFRLQSVAELVKDVYNLHSEAKYVGMFDMTNPLIMVRDPELIKSITLKHFDMFPDHRSFVDETQDPLFGKNLFSIRGERWRQVRSLLSPAFTSSKMKSMFKLMSECADDFATFLAQLPPEQRMIQVKDVFTRYTNDVIATCAFGITVDSMRNPKNQFYVYGKEATTFNSIALIKLYIFRSLPMLARLINLKIVRQKIADFFRDLVETTIKTRDENGIVRPDMLQLMMENRGKEGKPELSIEDMVSQAFIFFFGGFDSTSTLMCFAAHEIAVNPDIQKRLQDEIDRILEENNGEASYEAVNGMEYLDAVICEALRMYPVAVAVDRLCEKDFELPPALPGMKPFTIKKGQGIWIPIYGLQHDPKYFEEPEKFDPERFLGEKRKHSLNCGAYIPFGLGPRMCIGNRFALLETKVLLFYLLARCNLKVCEKTPIPIKIAKDGFNMKPEGGFWLNVEPRENIHHTLSTKLVNGTFYGLYHDSKYFEKPEKFDPKRFLNKRKKHTLNCGTFFPFDLGPRMCIGNRFVFDRYITMMYVITLSVIAGVLGFYYYFFKDWNYFKKHNILHKPPIPIVGNMGPSVFRLQSIAELIKDIYNLHSEAKYIGIFDMTKPYIIVRDPELIKSIALKHFDIFPDHRSFVNESQDSILGKNLFSIRGEKWRQVRSLLTPVFTSHKMKSMFKLMSKCAADFGSFLTQLPPEQRMMQMKDIFARYTNDMIATCAFGITVDSMRNPKNEFYVYGKEATSFDGIALIKLYIFRNFPLLARLINLKLIRQEIVDYFRDLVEITIKTRDENDIVRPDILQLLMENRNKEDKAKLTIEDMVSHAFIFFFGGFDTASTVMSFTAHEIAVNQDIQKKLQNEIDRILKENNGEASYEAVNTMEYLDAVIHEALRMYPPAATTDRLCVKDFELPPALPGMNSFTIKKGQNIWIPIYALHHDSKYFEKPEKFDPERFLGERRKDSLNCGAYIPFGLGPRMCIGNRFALLEVKVLFFHLLARCNLKVCEKTPIPLKLARSGIIMKPEGGFWLNVEPREITLVDVRSLMI
ncbi:hypothetical protein P5V15_005771 [Pogonomyrmex californicus]